MSIDPNPRRTPAYDPTDERYWDVRDLDQELRRVFEVCHTCRMCLPFCPSFPDLFARIDRDVSAGRATGAEALGAEDVQSVSELCFQCKLCYIKCPYTSDEGHPWLLDFPRLMLREKAQRARRDGVTLQDQVLGEPQWLGKLTAGPTARVANLVSASSLVRKVAARTAGISAKFPLPPFAVESFPVWFARHTPLPGAGEAGDVVLFATCFGDWNVTLPSIAAVRVLEHHGYRVHVAAEQTCCGMPNLDGGDVARAQEKARRNVEVLLPHVLQGRPVLIPSPTCSYMMSKEYPGLLGTTEASALAERSFDLMRWLDLELRRKKKLRKGWKHTFGKIAYQAPCHLRAQKIAFPAVPLLEATGAEVELIQECSAVDGTWGMKEQYYELGRKYCQRLVRAMREAGAEAYATDCPLSAQRISFELGGVRVRHPIEILARAYGFGDDGELLPEPSPPSSG